MYRNPTLHLYLHQRAHLLSHLVTQESHLPFATSPYVCFNSLPLSCQCAGPSGSSLWPQP